MDEETSGYLKQCRDCSEKIYMKLDHDDCWRPYESWAAGNVDEGVWEIHECGSGGIRVSSSNAPSFEKFMRQISSPPEQRSEEDEGLSTEVDGLVEDSKEGTSVEQTNRSRAWDVSSAQDLEHVVRSFQEELDGVYWDSWVELAEWRLATSDSEAPPPNILLEKDLDELFGEL